MHSVLSLNSKPSSKRLSTPAIYLAILFALLFARPILVQNVPVISDAAGFLDTTILAFLILSLGNMLVQAKYTAAAQQSSTDAGEFVFIADCSRCHNPPEQISPRIAGHMRVRANLSAQDDRDILKFLAP